MHLALFGLLLQLIVPQAGPVELEGYWRFHPGDSLSWAVASYPDGHWDSVRVPGRWSAGSGGYGWYRLSFQVSQPLREPLGLWFRSVATAYEVYVDGERVGSMGGMPPNYRARTVVPLVVGLPAAAQEPGRHVIAVRVYSAEPVGGILDRVVLGPVQALQRTAFRPDVYLIAAAVLLLGIGLMQMFFWMRRPFAREHLAIFGVCVSLALFYVWWMPSMRVALEPVIYWLRLYLASASACAAAYCYAFRRIFDLDRYDRVVFGFSLLFLVQAPLYLAAPGWNGIQWLATYVLNPSLLIGALVTLVLALLQLRQGAQQARTLLWGILLLTITLFHDILIDWGLLSLRPTFPWLTLVGSVGFVASLALTTAEKFVESEKAALYDRLTGLYRREVVMDALAREIRRATRMNSPLAVLMLDVDRFKQINDTLGHQAGDRVLTEIGRRMLEAGRSVDWLGRYGGEEFLAILAGSDKAGAVMAAERLRAAVSALPIPTGRTTRTVTMSVGVAAYHPGTEAPTVEQFVGAADEALYRAKNGGRNCVMS